MPAPDSSTHRSLTLSNGLRVSLCSAPRLKRCAAALRVAAGSHDVPEQWPGLAHFLEHLFFLGTERFAADENLMAYVQRHGGQLNASTRERTTDFFFELPAAVFAEGLERLCEMLAHPRLSMADQLREREVLHAEFIAWSRDAASRSQLKRLQPISPLHPLRWFHAGNRFSLPVPRPAFQQALQDFYRRFYQAGQMTLSLAGPQPLDALQALAETWGSYFAEGRRIDQLKPPALMDKPAGPCAEEVPGQAQLTFACEGLPPGHAQAAAFLCTWMNNAQPGGLVATLRDRGLIESLKAEVLYEFDGQVLLSVEAMLTDAFATEGTPSAVGARLPAKTSDARTQVSDALFNWLTFFKAHYRQLLNEYALLAQRRLTVDGALALARHYSGETRTEPGLSDQEIRAVDALLEALTPQRLLQSSAEIAPSSPERIDWRLPEPNPFLRPGPQTESLSGPLPSFTFSEVLPATGEAAAYLRWTLPAQQPKLALMLNDSLKSLTEDARQAGVALSFSAYGNFWQLKISGLAEPVPAVLEHALYLLSQPDAQTRSRYGQPSRAPVPIPIRQLLSVLPDHFLNSVNAAEIRDLGSVWANARWIGFATGLEGPTRPALTHALKLTPGLPEEKPIHPPALAPGKRWHHETSGASEDAVLVFYPSPSTLIEDEAIWRVFAHLVQAPFYQRLRVELQLGYAVFSGFRQIAGQSGLLFGVQSPSVRAEQLVDYVQSFMRTLPDLIESADLDAQITALQNQLDPGNLDSSQAAEMLWQAHLAGHSVHYLERLQHSFAHLRPEALQRAAHQVALPETTVFCLSNRPAPDMPGPPAR
ncbi:coenzyme PQQ biosynthesis probable peptidase PqqF [Pseudomonas sp. NFACC02]|uniref:pyrroloquinoline quinone biosynthesis protein PqqF n=1 Tax=Pseudomonas sp. NFACC02 TaxID=1566250 RepID=UPI0008B0547E|nr:pyrroloquinoline quinone biosynthesis protein PqqF [Pseudomonas sp. NFACC02]SER83383.1 coenzyme PQQ biosynthesis probable peptidase PqqF [Pseudomonas sp. NFACC02]